MNDSADIGEDDEWDGAAQVQASAARLKTVLDQLEKRIAPMSDALVHLRQKADDADTLKADRAELAERLDKALAAAKQHESALRDREDAIAAREREFAEITRNTEAEIQSVVELVQSALGEE